MSQGGSPSNDFPTGAFRYVEECDPGLKSAGVVPTTPYQSFPDGPLLMAPF